MGNHSRSAQPLTGHLSATFVQGGGLHMGGLNSVPKCGSHSLLSWQVVSAADWIVWVPRTTGCSYFERESFLNLSRRGACECDNMTTYRHEDLRGSSA